MPRRLDARVPLSFLIAPLFFSALPVSIAQGQGESKKAVTEKAPRWTGFFLGTLRIGALSLRIQLRISEEKGQKRLLFDSVDQGARGIRPSSTLFKGRKLVFEIQRSGIRYSGTLSEDGRRIRGTFEQGRKMALSFRRIAGDVGKKRRPQDPAEPVPYRRENVFFSHPGKASPEELRKEKEADRSSARITLAGTLTLPEGKGPFPAVVLVSGSGPQDRDEALMGHRPFLVIADALTRAGFAVLRYDDRGSFQSTGDFATATSADFAEDALAAVLFLRQRPDIDAASIGILGHSEGGLIAPIVAGKDQELGFVILMAGPSVRGDGVLLAQSARLMKGMGLAEKEVAKRSAASKELYDLLQKGGPKLSERLREKIGQSYDALSAREKQASGTREAVIQRSAQQLLSPWFRYFLSFDPGPGIAKLHCPVLVLNGSKDVQVLPEQNLPVFRRLLKQHKDATIKEFKGLNHLFQSCKTGLPAEYGKIEETVSPLFLETVSRWLSERFGRNADPSKKAGQRR